MAESPSADAFAPPARSSEGGIEDVEALKKEVARLSEENAQLKEAKARLEDEVETLKGRCQKLAKAAGAQKEAGGEAPASPAPDGLAEARIPPIVSQMLQSPKEEAVQTQGIDALFAQQTQASSPDAATPAANQAALEAAVAILRNHSGNAALLLKASQFLHVFLAEKGVQQQVPQSVLFQAAKEVVCMSDMLLAKAAAGRADAAAQASAQSPTKLLTWFLRCLASIFPCLDASLRDRVQSEEFIQMLLNQLIGPLLASAELPHEAAMLKCVSRCMELLRLLPMEPWIQKACLDSGAVHSLVLAYHRCASGANSNTQSGVQDLLKAFPVSLQCIFANNAELCVQAMGDAFVTDEFVCLEVLNELKNMEKKQRGTFRVLDEKWSVLEKALELWAFHQRQVLEASDPEKCSSREVLQKVAELLSSILAKLPPASLLQRMKDFESSEPLQRIALATLHANPQLRLQLSVNYAANDIGPVIVHSLQMLMRRFETDPEVDSASGAAVEVVFGLLQDEKLPAAGWTYVEHCLEICLHVLSHWSAAKLALPRKDAGVDGLNATAAPLLLAQGGLVDTLAELIDPVAAGYELSAKPPQAVYSKAVETLQNLFEQSAHVCLFCMQHYQEVKLVVSTASDSLAIDPLVDFPDMQRQAVEQLSTSFQKFSASPDDEKLAQRILKALANLFESSHDLVAWFLESHSLSKLGELEAIDVHLQACRAVSRAPYWSVEDAETLPAFVALFSELLLGSIEALEGPGRRLELNEAEEVATSCSASLLHLLLIDPCPPTVHRCLVESLSGGCRAEDDGSGSEAAVNNAMKIMQVFPSSDRVQMNCQHLLTSLLGE